MRFIADAMLGTLAKWLRILGYDTHFDTTLDDHQLVRLARAEGRVLLTRDRQLAHRRGVRTLKIDSQQLDEQIQQVLDDLDLEPERSFSLCPVCNEPLQPISPEEARKRVPAYVAQTQDSFRICGRCQRVYWRGTHWQQMDRHLSRLRPREVAAEDARTIKQNSENGG
jgi:uncharacterized protein